MIEAVAPSCFGQQPPASLPPSPPPPPPMPPATQDCGRSCRGKTCLAFREVSCRTLTLTLPLTLTLAPTLPLALALTLTLTLTPTLTLTRILTPGVVPHHQAASVCHRGLEL